MMSLFPIFHQDTVLLKFVCATLVGEKQHLAGVLICISYSMNETEHLFKSRFNFLFC